MALALSNKALADACIFDGSTVKCLRPGVRLFDGTLSAADYGVTRILTGADDPSAVAKFAERGSLYLRSSTAGHSTYQKQDDGTTTNWSALGGGSGSGEANTASNLGTGSQVFASKVGVDLQFRSFLGGGSTVVSQGTNEITVTSPAAENITGANTGSGIGIFLDKIASVLRFKTIAGGTNVTLSESNSTITINATSSGEANTASNVGGAAGVFKQKSGVDLQLRSIRSGQSTSVTQDTDTITVATSPAIGEVNTIRNRGSGVGLSLGKIDAEHQLATIQGSGSTSVSLASSTITISSSNVGEANTSSNKGSGIGLALPKVGVDLPFQSITGGGSTSASSSNNTVSLTSSASEIATMRNIGGQAGIFKSKIGAEFGLKGLTAGTNVTLTEGTNDITIAASGAGEANTASNIGTGLGPFKQKVGVDLQFYSFTAGQSTAAEQNGNDIRYRTSIPIPAITTIRNRGSGIGLGLGNLGATQSELQLASINASGSTSIAFASSTITLSSSQQMQSTCQNLGSGTGLCNGNTGANLQFKTVAAGSTATLSVSNNTVTFSPLSGNHWFGDGSDGHATVDGVNLILLRDMYYDSLTLTNGGTIAPSGFKIFVKNTLTIGSGSSITNNGANGINGSNGSGASGGAAGIIRLSAIPDGSIANEGVNSDTGGQGGGNGGINAAGTAGNAGGTGNSLTSAIGTQGANGTAAGGGGAGGANAGGAGGAAGSAGSVTATSATAGGARDLVHFTIWRIFAASNYPAYFYGNGSSASGAGGGGGGSNNVGAIGGGGGAGGNSGQNAGCLYIAANHIVDNSGLANGWFQARGGNGGNGGNGADGVSVVGAAGGGGGGSGGSGGQGGFAVIVTNDKIGPQSTSDIFRGTNTNPVAGGSGGTGGTRGAGAGGGANGVNGNNGLPGVRGRIILFGLME